jgi:hypothetical protein
MDPEFGQKMVTDVPVVKRFGHAALRNSPHHVVLRVNLWTCFNCGAVRRLANLRI